MEITIEQALQQGVAAHKEGKFQEAEHLYRIILEVQPRHPDANHNLGLLAIAAKKPAVALPLFKIAVDANPDIEQFWVSYINALMSEQKFFKATKVIEKTKEKNLKGKKLGILSDRLRAKLSRQNLKRSLDDFYESSNESNLSNAALGWFFTDSFDRAFVESKESPQGNLAERVLPKTLVDQKKPFDDTLRPDLKDTIQRLNDPSDITDWFNRVKEIIDSDEKNLLFDSFKEIEEVSFKTAQEKTFDSERLNLIILGSGVCGLFLACCLRTSLGELANVLVLEKRSEKQHTRAPFNREWLTHLSCDLFEKFVPESMKNLFRVFGKNGFVGLPINLIEALLMISCKDQGVKFYFSSSTNYAEFGENVDVVFDATGGNLSGFYRHSEDSTPLLLSIPRGNIGLDAAGVSQLHNTLELGSENLEISLRPLGAYSYPYIGDNQIYSKMIKLTKIPQKILEVVLESVKKINSLNTFYVWTGDLVPEINEGLVIINLKKKEYDYLSGVVTQTKNFQRFWADSHTLSQYVDEAILSFFRILVEADQEHQIKIEKPFTYRPYFNHGSRHGTISGKPLFPVGDSLFNGHPKMGNGLSNHLRFISDLIQNMIK